MQGRRVSGVGIPQRVRLAIEHGDDHRNEMPFVKIPGQRFH
jgi:hypothetical protein